MKAFTPKTLLSILLTSCIVSGIVYAATITSITSQTINAGDSMGASWFQAVNDRLVSLGNTTSCSGISSGSFNTQEGFQYVANAGPVPSLQHSHMSTTQVYSTTHSKVLPVTFYCSNGGRYTVAFYQPPAPC